MGQVVDYAGGIAEQLRDAGIKATHDVRQAVPPCVLVVPVPRYDYDLLDGSATATWTIVLLAPGAGDLTDARLLESMLDEVRAIVPQVTTAEPGAYQLPTAGDAKPAYVLTFETTITED